MNTYRIDVTPAHVLTVASTEGGGPTPYLKFSSFEELQAYLTGTLLLPDATIARAEDILKSGEPYHETAMMEPSVVQQFHNDFASRIK